MADSSTQELADVEWRRLSRTVWVGRRDGHHVGMIERGRDFVATDGEGAVQGRFHDLPSAQAFFASGAPAPGAQHAASPRPVWPFVVGGGTLALAAVAVSAAMLLQ